MESLCQHFDEAGFSVCEGLLVNDMDLAPILLILEVYCDIIGLLKKGYMILTWEDTDFVQETYVADPELYCPS